MPRLRGAQPSRLHSRCYDRRPATKVRQALNADAIFPQKFESNLRGPITVVVFGFSFKCWHSSPWRRRFEWGVYVVCFVLSLKKSPCLYCRRNVSLYEHVCTKLCAFIASLSAIQMNTLVILFFSFFKSAIKHSSPLPFFWSYVIFVPIYARRIWHLHFRRSGLLD